jgi:uncharacterized protein DUF4192
MQSTPGVTTGHPQHPGFIASTAGHHEPEVLLRLPDTPSLVRALPHLMSTPAQTPGLSILGLRQTRIVSTTFQPLHSADLTRTLLSPGPSELGKWWAFLLGPLAAEGATSVAIIALADASWTTFIHDFAHAAPYPVTYLVRVHQDRWHALDCPNPQRCRRPECGPDGASLSHTPAQTVPRQVRDTHEADLTAAALLEALIRDDDSTRAMVAAQLATHTRADRSDLLTGIHHAYEIRRSSAGRGTAPFTPAEASLLLRALADAGIRDACMIWDDDAAWQLWHDLLPTAPPGWIAPLSTLIAVMAYRREHLLAASYAVEHALTDDRDYALAVFLKDLINRDDPARTLDAGLDDARAHNLLGRADSAPASGERTGKE